MPKKNHGVVGYKNPPQWRQFQKGVSGNPNGRPKKEVGPIALFEEILKGRVMITDANGRRKSVTIEKLAMQQLANKVIKGDLSALKFYLSLWMQTSGARKEEMRAVWSLG